MKMLTSNRLGSIAFLLIMSFTGTRLAAVEPAPRISKIEAHSKLQRVLVKLDNRNPQLLHFGRPEFLNEINWGGVSTYELSYEKMRGDDFLGKWCPESFIVFRNKDGILHRLNYCPIGYGEDSIAITSGDKCIKAFQQFLQETNLQGRLTKEAKVRMFVTLCCHKYPEDFPAFLLTQSQANGPESGLDVNQQHCLHLMKRMGLLKKGRYFIVAVYGEQFAKSYTNKPTSEEWWHPWICYEFSFTQSGGISAVHATLLNRPGY